MTIPSYSEFNDQREAQMLKSVRLFELGNSGVEGALGLQGLKKLEAKLLDWLLALAQADHPDTTW